MTDPSEFKQPITAKTKFWFGDQMILIAIRQDLGGPDISLIDQERYRNEVVAEIRKRALAGLTAGEVVFELAHLETLCELAADELIRLRQIRHAHSSGTLPTLAMKQLPVYAAFQGYFDEDPALIRRGLAAALARREARIPDSSSPAGKTEPLEGAKSLSAKTEQWLETQVLGFALAEDMTGKPCEKVNEGSYVHEAAPRFRNNIFEAMQIGNLTIPVEAIDDLCRLAVVRALKLRRLKARYVNGRISRRKLKQLPEYKQHQEYLEGAPAMGNLMSYACALHKALGQHRNAKTN